jgi:hypothetical protein
MSQEDDLIPPEMIEMLRVFYQERQESAERLLAGFENEMLITGRVTLSAEMNEGLKQSVEALRRDAEALRGWRNARPDVEFQGSPERLEEIAGQLEMFVERPEH